jgi:hypothetical protein
MVFILSSRIINADRQHMFFTTATVFSTELEEKKREGFNKEHHHSMS